MDDSYAGDLLRKKQELEAKQRRTEEELAAVNAMVAQLTGGRRQGGSTSGAPAAGPSPDASAAAGASPSAQTTAPGAGAQPNSEPGKIMFGVAKKRC
jgi:hypothetical protein